MAKELKRSDYLAAVKDLISVMGLQDDNGQPLTIGAKSNADELKTFITDCMGQIDPETDEFANGTVTILESLGYKGFSGEEEKETEETPTKEKEEDDWKEPESKGEELLQARVATAKKLSELKALVLENPEFKKLVKGIDKYQGLAGPRELKAEMQKIIGIPDQTVAAPKQTKTKAGASADVVRRRQAIEAMIETGKYTARQIAEKISADFERSLNSVLTELADGKNPKYNRFSKLVQSTNHILHF